MLLGFVHRLCGFKVPSNLKKSARV
uniref:Uncharacterized protein n=1 Tax=Arundo donax TaxID=35708 RepID=A0A0A9BR12_ARUDO